jgi:hypothetical protein
MKITDTILHKVIKYFILYLVEYASNVANENEDDESII